MRERTHTTKCSTFRTGHLVTTIHLVEPVATALLRAGSNTGLAHCFFYLLSAVCLGLLFYLAAFEGYMRCLSAQLARFEAARLHGTSKDHFGRIEQRLEVTFRTSVETLDASNFHSFCSLQLIVLLHYL